jgi:hypothetical protein
MGWLRDRRRPTKPVEHVLRTSWRGHRLLCDLRPDRTATYVRCVSSEGIELGRWSAKDYVASSTVQRMAHWMMHAGSDWRVYMDLEDGALGRSSRRPRPARVPEGVVVDVEIIEETRAARGREQSGVLQLRPGPKRRPA